MSYKESKAEQPSYKGDHYADSPEGTGGMLNITHDPFGNEIAADKPMHENTTPGMGAFNFGGGHYSDGPWKGGYGSDYGVSVGGNSSSETTVVNVGRADRGKES